MSPISSQNFDNLQLNHDMFSTCMSEFNFHNLLPETAHRTPNNPIIKRTENKQIRTAKKDLKIINYFKVSLC